MPDSCVGIAPPSSLAGAAAPPPVKPKLGTGRGRSNRLLQSAGINVLVIHHCGFKGWVWLDLMRNFDISIPYDAVGIVDVEVMVQI